MEILCPVPACTALPALIDVVQMVAWRTRIAGVQFLEKAGTGRHRERSVAALDNRRQLAVGAHAKQA